MGGLFTKAQVADRLFEMIRQGLARPEDVIRWDATGQLSSSIYEQLKPELPVGIDFTQPMEMIDLDFKLPEPPVVVPETEWDIL